MAVQNDTSRIQYNGNNSTVNAYAIPFPFFENSHIRAVVTTSAGVDTELALGSGFTLTGAGNPNGGSLVTVAAVPTTSKVTIFRNVPATQTTSYQEGGDFPAASHERALDKLTQIAQQTKRLADRALKVPESQSTNPPDLPNAGPGKKLFSSDNGALTWEENRQPPPIPATSTPRVLTTVNGNPSTWETPASASANLDIAGMTPATTVTASDNMIVDQGGVPQRASLSQLSNVLAQDGPPTWVRTSSKDNNPNDPGIIAAISWDGIAWQSTTQTPTFPAGVFSRDASVIYHEPTSRWVCLSTDAFTSSTKTFGVATSPELRTWTVLPPVLLTGPATVGTANNVWAPEWFVEDGNYYVLVRLSTTAGKNLGAPGMGYLRCLNPGTWTQWTDWEPFDNTVRPDANDFSIIKRNGLYYLFSHGGTHLSNNLPPGLPLNYDITVQVSSSLFSGYSPMVPITAEARTIVRPNNSSMFFEGPNVVHVKGDHYRLYFQDGIVNAGWAFDSYDGMETWDINSLRPMQYIGLDGRGHGTVIKVTPRSIDSIQSTIRLLNDGQAASWAKIDAPNEGQDALGVAEPPALLLRTWSADTNLNNAGGINAGISYNGISWYGLTPRSFFPNFSRDASTIYHNNQWVTVYTDAFGSSSKTFGLATTANFENWTVGTPVTLTGPATSGTANNVWAPEWFIDNGNFYVLVRLSTTAGNNVGPPGMGYLRCLNPGTWTQWTDWTPFDSSVRTDANDFYIIKRGSLYYLFSQAGTHLGLNPPGLPAIFDISVQTSSAPFSGYSAPVFITQAVRTAIGAAFCAGPSVLQLTSNRYRLYFQNGSDNLTWCVDSFDGMQTWPTSSLRRLQYLGIGRDGAGTVLRVPINTSAFNSLSASISSSFEPLLDAPASATSRGFRGQKASDSDYLYVCTADNTWRRTPIVTW